jgi:hypothetical protein
MKRAKAYRIISCYNCPNWSTALNSDGTDRTFCEISRREFTDREALLKSQIPNWCKLPDYPVKERKRNVTI